MSAPGGGDLERVEMSQSGLKTSSRQAQLSKLDLRTPVEGAAWSGGSWARSSAFSLNTRSKASGTWSNTNQSAPFLLPIQKPRTATIPFHSSSSSSSQSADGTSESAGTEWVSNEGCRRASNSRWCDWRSRARGRRRSGGGFGSFGDHKARLEITKHILTPVEQR